MPLHLPPLARLLCSSSSLILVLVFEFSNGFHDTANAVATVIYTRSLDAVPAVMWSALLNFLGVMLGGLAVAYTVVDLIPPDVLTPPDGNPAVGMLIALFAGAILWNVGTWYVGIPCSSSHAIIGAVVGVGLAHSLTAQRGLRAVDWGQVLNVGEALLVSPLLGFALAALLFRLLRAMLHDRRLFKPPPPGERPPWWVRGLLICTCAGVSFSHGSNDGQKSIGLIMLTIIGLAPIQYALNRELGPPQFRDMADAAQRAIPLIEKYGDDEKAAAATAARNLAARFKDLSSLVGLSRPERNQLRGDIYMVKAQMKQVARRPGATAAEKGDAAKIATVLKGAVQNVPWWVQLLSALCLGLGTAIGYKRIVRTIGERIGNEPMTPAQGGSAEVVGAVLIGTAGWHGLPVSTTHIVSSGVAGTMAVAGAGVQRSTIRDIILAWVLTLPATMLISGLLFYWLG